MTSLLVKDSTDTTQYIGAEGAGTIGDPFILKRAGTTRGINIPVALTVTSGVYTIGDVVGGLITLAGATRVSGGRSKVTSVTLNGVAALAYNLVFLNADIATPAADNAPFTLVAGDMTKVLGHVPIVAGDYKAAASAFNMGCVKNVGLQVSATATTLYAYLIATATTTPGTTSLRLSVGLEYLD